MRIMMPIEETAHKRNILSISLSVSFLLTIERLLSPRVTMLVESQQDIDYLIILNRQLSHIEIL
jgi:hypothetical protein